MKKKIFLIWSLLASIVMFGQEENQDNHWNPDESLYSNTMDVIAVVSFNNIEQNNVNYEVGVFCNEELRGSARAQYVQDFDRYCYFITIYGNDNDVVEFRLYDHESQTELEYISKTTLDFEVSGVEGNPNSPFVINFDASSNHWTPVEGLESTMTCISVITFNGEEQRSEYYEIGAFCGEEVRGSQRAQYVQNLDRYFVFLSIAGNDNDVITFKIYDHEEQQELDYDSESTVKFTADATNGTPAEPVSIDFTSPIKIYTFIGEGSWNEHGNWKNEQMPTLETDNVIISGNATLPTGVNSTINSMVIKRGSLTIENEASLKIISEFSNADTSSIIINDGGELYYTGNSVAATFRKNIVNPDGIWGENDKTGWQFISSPMQNSSVTDFIPATGDYDLYKYDGTLKNQWYNYKQTIEYDFDTEDPNWTIIDADGDHYQWYWNSDGYYISASYSNGTNLKPDNYLVCPRVMIEKDMQFNFMVSAADPECPEYCGVWISEDGANFTPIEGWTIDKEEWTRKSVSLDEYAGREMYVAIRHYNVTGQYRIYVDNVSFSREGASFENGIAYLASYSEEKTAVFKGVLNNENSYSITVNYDEGNTTANYSLIGNPFSYNINWEEDIKLNNIDDGYALIKKDGAYGYRNSGIIKMGEGFMIHSNDGKTQTITMQKGINQASKPRNISNSIDIIACGSSGSDNVIINLGDDSSRFPKLENINDKVATIYVMQNDTTFGICSYDNETKEIPLYFDAKEMGNYTLSFDVKGNYNNIYLIDKTNGEKINILLENEYSFIANSDDNTDRFVLSFDNIQQQIGNSSFAYLNNGDLIITGIDGDTQINIYDVMGRCVYNASCGNDVHIIPTATDRYENGVYIIKKTNKSGIEVQKMIL